jgi:hypothetical protein
MLLLLHESYNKQQIISPFFPIDGASEEEMSLSKMVMKFWVNFAQNG